VVAKKTPKSSKSSKRAKSSVRKKKGEPRTMEQLMSMYGGSFKTFTPGEHVMTKVVSIAPNRVILDIAGKTEGLVAERAYKEAENFIKTLKPGDEVEGVVLVSETKDGYTVISLRQAAQKITWGKIEKAHNSEEPIKVEGKSVNPSGVLVDVDGITGFIPISQLGKEAVKKPQDLVGTKFEVKVIDFDKSQNKVVLSEKEVSEKEEIEKLKEALETIKEGEEFEGVINTIYDFGVFVEIDAPIGKGMKAEKVPLEGLVHISELSWDKIGKPEEIVSVGDNVKVKVIGKNNGKLALSIKQTQKDPWEEAEKRYPKDKKVEGKVVRVSDFGMFVSLEPGVEGLVHITKIPPTKKFEVGDDVNVVIEEIDSKAKKLSLGLVLTAKPVGYK
jgi:small subunit ribosomal protein S1